MPEQLAIQAEAATAFDHQTAGGLAGYEAARDGAHATSWAVGTALRALGFDAPAERLLFGLGASCWLHLDERHGQPVIRGLHPDRLQRTWFALNVWAMRSQCLSSDVFAALEERCARDELTLVNVNRWLLEGAPEAPPASLYDYTVLVAGVKADATHGKMVQVLTDRGERLVTESQFREAWFQPLPDGYRGATYLEHPITALNLNEAQATRGALRRFAQQMHQNISGLGSTGLAVFPALRAHLERGRFGILEATSRLRWDDQQDFGRQAFATFLDHAAETTLSLHLSRAAGIYDAAAEAWRALLDAFVTPPYDATFALEQLVELESLEARGLELIEQFLRDLAG